MCARVAEESGLLADSLRERPRWLNENFQKLITEKPSSSHCDYGRGRDGSAGSQGSSGERALIHLAAALL